WPSSTNTRVTRPPTMGVTATCLYAFASTTPGSRSAVAARPGVTVASTIPARWVASGVNVTTTSDAEPPGGTAVGDGERLGAAGESPRDGCGTFEFSEPGRIVKDARPAPTPTSATAPTISAGHANVTREVPLIELLPKPPSAPVALHRPPAKH